MKIHLMTRESVTPIGRYLERSRANATDLGAQIDLAALVLYREREYVTTHYPLTLSGPKAVPSPDSWFQPYDITPEGAAALESTASFDLFGLKPGVVAQLRPLLRPIAAHKLGWLLLARLLEDCGLAREAEEARRVAKRIGAKEGRDFNERIRRAALTARAREEGPAFTRFWTTEQAFCEEMRAKDMLGFDDAKVPAALHGLVDLAQAYGFGDDVCRGRFLRRLSRPARAAVASRVKSAGPAIDEWLAAQTEPYGVEAQAFYWLRHAAEEI
jgi:hypothetical protein